MPTLLSHPLLPSQSPTDVSLRYAEDCVRHGVGLPAAHVRALVEHCLRVHRAAEAADRFLRSIQIGARHNATRSVAVPAEVARRFRNQIRAPLGWPPVLPGDEP